MWPSLGLYVGRLRFGDWLELDYIMSPWALGLFCANYLPGLFIYGPVGNLWADKDKFS